MKKNLLLKIALVFECLMTLAWFLWGTFTWICLVAFTAYSEEPSLFGSETPEEAFKAFCSISLTYLFISIVFVTSIILTTKLVQKKQIAKISQILLPFMVLGEIWLTIWFILQII